MVPDGEEKPFVCIHCEEGFKQRVQVNEGYEGKRDHLFTLPFFLRHWGKAFCLFHRLNKHGRLSKRRLKLQLDRHFTRVHHVDSECCGESLRSAKDVNRHGMELHGEVW